jgi:hypothetical protein
MPGGAVVRKPEVCSGTSTALPLRETARSISGGMLSRNCEDFNLIASAWRESRQETHHAVEIRHDPGDSLAAEPDGFTGGSGGSLRQSTI